MPVENIDTGKRTKQGVKMILEMNSGPPILRKSKKQVIL